MKLDHLEQVQNQVAVAQKKAMSLIENYYAKGVESSKRASLKRSFQQPASMSIYKILRNCQGDKLLSYSAGKVDNQFLDEASDCIKDFVTAGFDLNESTMQEKFPTIDADKLLTSVIASHREGVKSGLRGFIKTTAVVIASQLIRITPEKPPMIATAISYDSINAALTDLIGVEYEVLTKSQKKKLEDLYKSAHDMGFKTVTPDIFLNRSSLVYQMLKERVDTCPFISDEEFVAKIKAGDSEVIDSILKASDYNGEDFAFDVYSKVFIDGIYNIKFDPKAYSFVSNAIVDFVRSSGYADGIESAINQIAPKLISNYAISEL